MHGIKKTGSQLLSRLPVFCSLIKKYKFFIVYFLKFQPVISINANNPVIKAVDITSNLNPNIKSAKRSTFRESSNPTNNATLIRQLITLRTIFKAVDPQKQTAPPTILQS